MKNTILLYPTLWYSTSVFSRNAKNTIPNTGGCYRVIYLYRRSSSRKCIYWSWSDG